MAKKKQYTVVINDISFYDSSPHTAMSDFTLGTFKTRRKAEEASLNALNGLEGLLSYGISLWRTR